MRYLYRPFLAFLLALGLAASAAGAELPEQVVVEDRNGSQRLIKTFVVSPQTDPDSLREDPFLYEGRNYTWAYTTKEEHTALDVKSVTETVTVETQEDDLASILMELDSVLPYDQDGYTGELILDHTTLDIQAAGHEERYGTLTDIQVFSDLPGNDADQIPASTERDGATLPLVHVEWQEEAPSEEAPAVPRYQAVAIYAATTSYSGATGYLTTAQYSGQVTNSGVDSVTYTVVYTGQSAEPAAEPGVPFSFSLLPVPSLVLAAVPLAAALMSLVLVCLRRRTNVRVYVPSGRPRVPNRRRPPLNRSADGGTLPRRHGGGGTQAQTGKTAGEPDLYGLLDTRGAPLHRPRRPGGRLAHIQNRSGGRSSP